MEASKRIGRDKASGPDLIPNRALLVAIDTKPDELVALLNSCLEEGIFPQVWKKQRLLLIPQGTKAPEDLSGYRPICLLDTIGKILERIVCDRLIVAIENAGDLSDFQFGFTKGAINGGGDNLGDFNSPKGCEGNQLEWFKKVLCGGGA